jgi:hypothetical protein
MKRRPPLGEQAQVQALALAKPVSWQIPAAVRFQQAATAPPPLRERLVPSWRLSEWRF